MSEFTKALCVRGMLAPNLKLQFSSEIPKLKQDARKNIQSADSISNR